jgi:hypothetical protein
MRLLAGLEQRDPAPDPRVAEDHRRRAVGPGLRGGGVERGQQRLHVVAVDALREPAGRPPLVLRGLDAQHRVGGPVGLQGVHVDHRGEPAEPVVGGAHRGLPRRALVELAVGEEVEHAGVGALQAQAERHPDGHGQAVPERPAGDLHARRVGGHPGHRQP